ncbi:MAG: flagellin [Thermomicrobiales bacterium]
MRINTNVEALNAQRNLNVTGQMYAKSIEKLSSGLRINRAADDAAGLSISEKLRSQVRGVNQAIRNSQDGISMIQTAEGALNEAHDIVQRMRELSVQAGNDTLSSADRVAIGDELSQLRDEIDGIASRTNFNGKNLLNGSLAVAQDTGTSTLNIGTTVGTTAITALDVSGAEAGETYTASYDATNDLLTLTRGSDSVSLGTVFVADTPRRSTSANWACLVHGYRHRRRRRHRLWPPRWGWHDRNERRVPATRPSRSASTPVRRSTLVFNAMASNAIGGGTTVDAAVNTCRPDDLLQHRCGVQGATRTPCVTSAGQRAQDISAQRPEPGLVQNRLEHTVKNLRPLRRTWLLRKPASATPTWRRRRSSKAQIPAQAGTAILAQANQAPQSVLGPSGSPGPRPQTRTDPDVGSWPAFLCCRL